MPPNLTFSTYNHGLTTVHDIHMRPRVFRDGLMTLLNLKEIGLFSYYTLFCVAQHEPLQTKFLSAKRGIRRNPTFIRYYKKEAITNFAFSTQV